MITMIIVTQFLVGVGKEKKHPMMITFAIRYVMRRKNDLRVFFFFYFQWYPKKYIVEVYQDLRPMYCFSQHVLIYQWMRNTALLGEVCDDFWLPCYVRG